MKKNNEVNNWWKKKQYSVDRGKNEW